MFYKIRGNAERQLTAANIVPLIRIRASSSLLYELANYKPFSTFIYLSIYLFFINPSVHLLLCVLNLNIYNTRYIIAFTYQISILVFNHLGPQETKRESRRL